MAFGFGLQTLAGLWMLVGYLDLHATAHRGHATALPLHTVNGHNAVKAHAHHAVGRARRLGHRRGAEGADAECRPDSLVIERGGPAHAHRDARQRRSRNHELPDGALHAHQPVGPRGRLEQRRGIE